MRDWSSDVCSSDLLPAITLASVSTAYTARIMRSQLLEVMNQDYIRTARAKGLSRRATILHHALKNALIPVVTYIGIDFGAMLAGAILTETVFNWPGVGYETYRAITKTFRIVAKNNSAANKYIRSVTLNGAPYDKSYIDFAAITAGGVLEFTMGSEPADFL